MSGSSDTDNDTVMDIINDIHKHRPRHVFEIPPQIVMLVKRNNELMEAIMKRMDAGINGPWLRPADAAKYLRVSKSTLLRSLKDKKIKSYTEPDGSITVYHINDLDAYWREREAKRN